MENFEITLLALRKNVETVLEQIRAAKSAAPARKRQKKVTEQEALADLTARVITGKLKKK